jgi:RNA recognition motif-containing protein
VNIFVAQLNYRTRTEDLERLFTEFGEVSSCKIITDRETGRSKGFGFVEMPDDAAAQEAISALDGIEFEERNIVVKQARPKSDNRGGYGDRRSDRRY